MSSILTNNGAMVALQTMKSINRNMAQLQSEISTGKSISNAKDNAAVWAISKTMESDVKGFKGISDSLALGSSTIAVARKAAETVTNLLTEIKGKVVAAQEENVDRTKIQTDIVELRNQIDSVVKAAQFNGLNLVSGDSADPVRILSSLDRNATGVTSAEISVGRRNLSVTTDVQTQVFGAGAGVAGDMTTSGAQAVLLDGTPFAAGNRSTVADGANQTITIGAVSAGKSFEIEIGNVSVNVAGGGTTLGSRTFQYVASATDGTAEVARNLQAQISAFFGAATSGSSDYEATLGTGANTNVITITNGPGTPANAAMTIGLRAATAGTAGTNAASGGLGALTTMDVTSDSGATGALAAIEGLIQQSISAAAEFGSSQKRIEIQSDFISELSDTLKSGIGALVDANMEEASARLQALQVQQQLATQSLSIANQAPQNILALFR